MMNHGTDAAGQPEQAPKFPTLPMNYALAPYSGAVWRPTVWAGIEYRDLNLAEASGGQMGGRHLRAVAMARFASWGVSEQQTFLCLFVLSGKLQFTAGDGQPVELVWRDTAHVSALRGGLGFEASADFEALEIAAPAIGTVGIVPHELMQVGHETPDETRKANAINRERPEAYALGDGPRSYFLYRDIGASEQTGRRIHIHVINATKKMPGGTGWHDHSMSQLFYVLGGSAVVRVEKHGEVRMCPGDAMCIPAGVDHDVPDFDADYQVLEMCLPGDYSTVNQPRKEIAATV